MFRIDFHDIRGQHYARGERHDKHHHNGHSRHGRGAGRSNPTDLELRRFFAHGDLGLMILRLIGEKRRHSDEIIMEIEDRGADAHSPSPGMIYPTLTLLGELGYVAVSPGEGTRKLHESTEAGRAFLTADSPAVDALFVRMAEASEARGRGPEPRIRGRWKT